MHITSDMSHGLIKIPVPDLFLCVLFSHPSSEILYSHVHPPFGNRHERRIPMNKKVPETASEKKYFVLFETDEEGIRQFQSCSDQDRSGAMLSKMCIEGRMVPALKLEVDKNAYEIFKREQWMQEHHYRIENRCIISGQNGKSRFCPVRVPNPEYTPDNDQPKTLANSCTACPHNRIFNLMKGKACFSTLSVTDKDGNQDPYEPQSVRDINFTDHYQELLNGWISFIQKNYPQYSRYVELINLLGNEFTLKEASAILNRPQRTLYGWVQTLRPIFKEYMNTIDYL